MPVACPRCGSRFLRDSHPRNFGEIVRRLWFVAPLRCLDCKTRFVASTLILSDLQFARCPACYRMDLNGWTGKSYTPPFLMGLKIRFGATRFRCEYCRHNFASFRKRKEPFTFKRWEKLRAKSAKGGAQRNGAMREADCTAKNRERAVPPGSETERS
jgi:DNA-directed RNA polymerase subunit RPC12/RpoP